MRIYRIAVLLMALLLNLTSCNEPDSYSAISENSKHDLQEWAGTLARYWVFKADDSLRPDRPEDTDLLSLIQSCESNPESWAYLYSCIADTIAILDPPSPSCQQ
ncbi:MAG: hypothetical protein K8S15_07640 [Candidatus Aegiribacteria sp.]|nr:hypothetical protein [Candidatus Aegiribacteria sp.]